MTLPDAGKWNPERYKSPRHAKPAPGRPGRRSAPAVRLQRLVSNVRAHFSCGAVALLQLEEDHLRPVAVDGLTQDALGRRFAVQQHPGWPPSWRAGASPASITTAPCPTPDGLINGMAGEPLRCTTAWAPACMSRASPGRADAGRAGGRHLRRRGPVRIARADHAGGSGAAHHAAGGRDARAAPDAGQSGPTRPPTTTRSWARASPSPACCTRSTWCRTRNCPSCCWERPAWAKELFAHRVHRLSRRRAKPLVHVNCAAPLSRWPRASCSATPRGAFSGAVADRPGCFEAANGGTLFLDEVGELPLLVQAKLLRALQNGEIQRLGDDRPRRVDVRIVAATNRSLKDLVRDGDFRADLYHRLSVYPIAIPPLRGAATTCCCWPAATWNRTAPGWAAQPAAGAGRRRGAAPLPLAGQCARAGACHQPRRHQGGEPGRQPQPHRHAGGQPAGPVRRRPASSRRRRTRRPPRRRTACCLLRDAVDACQRQHVRLALQAHDGNWAAAARVLEVDPSNLHKLARRLGLKG